MACGFPGNLGVEARGLEPSGTPSGPQPPALCSFSPSGLSRAGARSTSKPAAGRSHVWPPCAVSPLAGLSRAGAPAAPPVWAALLPPSLWLFEWVFLMCFFSLLCSRHPGEDSPDLLCLSVPPAGCSPSSALALLFSAVFSRLWTLTVTQ